MRGGVLVAVSIASACSIAAACSSFGGAESGPGDADDAGTATDAGPGADANTDGGAPETCTEEQKKTPQHCGRCDRNCGFGQCVEGECTAYKIVDGAEAWYIAVDATHVYWSVRSARKIMRAPKTGGTAEQVRSDIDAFDVAPLGSALFTSVVAGSASDGIYRGSIDGQGGNPVKIADGGIEIATLGGTAYAFDITTTNQLFAVQATGDPTMLGGAFGVATDGVEGIATDGVYAYFTKHLPGPEGAVLRRPLGAGPPYLTVADGLERPRRISVDDQFVYWTGGLPETGGVYRAPKTGGQPQQILTGNIRYGRAIVSGDRVYVTVEVDGKVVRTSTDGANRADILTGLKLPVGLAQDDKAIYFGENDPAGAIWRMVK